MDRKQMSIIFFFICLYRGYAQTPRWNTMLKEVQQARTFERYSVHHSNVTELFINPTKELQPLFDRLIHHNFTNDINDKHFITTSCQDMLMRYINDVKFPLLNYYTIQVSDSFGRKPAGTIISTTVFGLWYGAYDQCVDVKETRNDYEDYFTGQYCLNFVSGPGTGVIYPITWGSCVPKACDATEVNTIFNLMLQLAEDAGQSKNIDYFQTIGCSENKLLDRELNVEAYIAISVIFIFVLLAMIGTSYDLVVQSGHVTSSSASLEVKENAKIGAREISPRVHLFLMAFSMPANCKKLLGCEVRDKKIANLNGMRALSMLWVLFGHTAFFILPMCDNSIRFFTYTLQSLTWQIVGYSTVSVDSFFFMSGFLVGYMTLKTLHKNKGKLNWFLYYFHRFWRLTPLYMFLLLVYFGLYTYIIKGPNEMAMGLTQDRLNCKDVWWTNLLYINNFYADRMADLCMGWTWYLPNDMQFYIVSPLMLYFLYKIPALGITICLFFLLTTLITTGVVANVYDMSPLLTFEMTEEQAIIKDHTYIRPYYRMAPYLVGLILSYILLMKNFRFQLSKLQNAIGWTLAAACNLSVIYGLFHYHDEPGEKTKINPDLGYFFFATHRFAWSLGLAWVVFACSTGNGGVVNSILSWRAWMPIARLSYGMYLVHEVVMAVYIGSTRVPLHATSLNIAFYFFAFFIGALLCAFAASLLVEGPFMGIEKVFFYSPKQDKKPSETLKQQKLGDPDKLHENSHTENDYTDPKEAMVFTMANGDDLYLTMQEINKTYENHEVRNSTDFQHKFTIQQNPKESAFAYENDIYEDIKL